MHRGYVKLFRKMLDNGVIKNAELFRFWCWCLLKASHQEYETVVGYQKVLLKPGQFVFGRKSAAEQLSTTEQSIRTLVSCLKTRQQITTKPTNKFTIVTICNWELYQSYQEEEQPAKQPAFQPTTNQQLTSKQPTTNHKQECKALEECNKQHCPDEPGQVEVVFDYWKETLNHRKSILDAKRKRTISTALKNHSVESLKKAIDGCKNSPWHQGQNDRKMVYDSISLLFRDADQIDKFIALSNIHSVSNQSEADDAIEETRRKYLA